MENSFEQKLRPRRMRINENVRAMVRETNISVKDFVYPIFVVPGENIKEERMLNLILKG